MRRKFFWTIDNVLETVGPTVLVVDEVELAHPVELVGDVQLLHQKLPISSFFGPRKALDGSRHPDDVSSISIQFLLCKEIGERLVKTKIHAIDYTGSASMVSHGDYDPFIGERRWLENLHDKGGAVPRRQVRDCSAQGNQVYPKFVAGRKSGE